MELSRQAGRIKIDVNAELIGHDLLVVLTGGASHIGAVAGSTIAGSLATSSVITMPGHREDRIAKPAAEKLSKALNINTVVVAGVHFDSITKKEIELALKLSDELVDDLVVLCKE